MFATWVGAMFAALSVILYNAPGGDGKLVGANYIKNPIMHVFVLFVANRYQNKLKFSSPLHKILTMKKRKRKKKNNYPSRK